MKDVQYKLTLSPEQAKMVDDACELYARIRMGQWGEIAWHCLDLADEDFCEDREKLEKLLLAARSVAYPELAEHPGTSYGVGKFKDATMVWEVHEVLRNKIAWTEHPEGGWGVDFGEPCSFSGIPLAKCEVVKK